MKTASEASRIPSISDNVTALRVAARAGRAAERSLLNPATTGIEAEARSIIDRVLDLHADLGRALTSAFALGYLDVPYCLHPDNAGRTRSYITDDGRLQWAATGALPITNAGGRPKAGGLTSAELLHALSYVRDRYDTGAFAHH